MRVLVTGGAGFIGSHLCEKLLERGHEVVCFDNFNDFYDPLLKQRNIEKALAHNKFTLVIGDILDRDALDRLFNNGFDAVMHLAAYGGVRYSSDRPDVYQRVNIDGTSNLLESCRTHEVPRFLFASTAAVYGSGAPSRSSETDNVMRPTSPYAASKVAAEALCYTYHHLFRLNVQLLRLYTVYGPRQRPEMAIPLFTHYLKKGDPIPVFGNGSSSRDYIYIDDAVDGLIAALHKCDNFEVINIGSGVATPLNQLIDVLAQRLRVKPDIQHHESQTGDVSCTLADTTKAAEILGLNPRVGFEEGVDRYCSWFETGAGNVPGGEID